MTQIKTVATDRAPAAIGPYSQATVSEGWIYASGQIPIDPASGELETGTIEAQTELVLRNLRSVLEAGGGDLSTVVKTTVYLSDMANFTRMNEVYATYFQEHRPARATVQAAGLPRGVDVEIDAVARVR
jgi:2-iminobutanoate/2-iminopropanoate deaminase